MGVNITSSGNLVKEIKNQDQKAARVANCLNDLVWRNKYARKETKSKIYKATVARLRHIHWKQGQILKKPDTCWKQMR